MAEDNLSELPKFDDGQPVFSASQVSTAMLCLRKWGFYALEGIVSPQSPAAELGSKVHGVLENWLKNGQAPDLGSEEGKIATAGLSFLPPPGKADIEQHFLIRTPIAEYQGYKDATWWEEKRRIVCDHKTTGDFKWAKTEDDLRTDIQAALYAADEMSKHNLQEVELRWIYYRTKGANQAKRVSLVIHKEQVEKNFDVIDAMAKVMLEAHRSGKKALDLPPTVTACGAFGGCPHIERCNLQSKDIMRSIMAQQSLADKLRARAGGTAWVPHPSDAAWEWNQATGEMRQVGSAPPVVTAPPVPTISAPPPVPSMTTGAPPVPMVGGAPPVPMVGVVPVSTSTVPPVPMPIVPPTNGTVMPMGIGAVGILPPEAPNPRAPVVPPPAVPGPLAVPVAPAIPAVSAVAPPVLVPTYGQSVVSVPGSGIVLYLNCQPTKSKRELVSFMTFIEPVLTALYKENNVQDYRLIPQGAAKLTVGIKAMIAHKKPNVSVVLSTMSQEGRDCVAVLSELADEVVSSLDC